MRLLGDLVAETIEPRSVFDDLDEAEAPHEPEAVEADEPEAVETATA